MFVFFPFFVSCSKTLVSACCYVELVKFINVASGTFLTSSSRIVTSFNILLFKHKNKRFPVLGSYWDPFQRPLEVLGSHIETNDKYLNSESDCEQPVCVFSPTSLLIE